MGGLWEELPQALAGLGFPRTLGESLGNLWGVSWKSLRVSETSLGVSGRSLGGASEALAALGSPGTYERSLGNLWESLG